MNEEDPPKHPEAQPPRAEGVTESERYLKELCEKSFLSFWSYPAVYTDRGKTKPNGHGKELCDLLVVFENHIIIFSDKDCEFPETGDLVRDWSRWFRRAVYKSAEQIWGAERWIRENPNRVFLDRACTQKFPIEFPSAERAKFHRVVVAHGGSVRCRAELEGSGSLMLMPYIVGEDHMLGDNRSDVPRYVIPFAVGQLDPTRGFVHVLDDTSLDILLGARDTITDFVSYLSKKEEFIESGRLLSAAGEEDLLAFYLRQLNANNEHDFELDEQYTHIAIAEGEWERFSATPERIRQIDADRISYLWDNIIERFTAHFMNGTSEFCSHTNYSDQEKLFRFFARERRFSRRMLSDQLLETFVRGQNGERYLRLRPPLQQGDPFYAFMTLKPSLDVFKSLENYRKARRFYLESVCQVVRLVFPEATDIVGLAFEPKDRQDSLSSEDAVYFDARTWNDELEAEAKELQIKHKILTKATAHRRSYQEYPHQASHDETSNDDVS